MTARDALELLPGLVIGLTFHEAAHAITAKWLGDRTSEKMGRVSLNPFKHLSPLGTLALFFLGFGWGKPVIVNLYNFERPKLYYLLSSLAGPAANLLICAVMLGVMYLPMSLFWWRTCLSVFLINAVLATVNLLPVPPLDGSKIWPCLIPGMRPTVSGKWAMVWVVVLILSLKGGLVATILDPVIHFGSRLVPEPQFNQPSPEGFPEIIIAPEKSKDIRYWIEPRGAADPNQYCMHFARTEAHPAEGTLELLCGRLKADGWRKLDYLLMDPNSTGGTDWEREDSEYEEATYYTWSEDWIDDAGRIVSIDLEYEVEMGSDDPGEALSGYLWLLEESWTRDWLRFYRGFHPEEFVELRE